GLPSPGCCFPGRPCAPGAEQPRGPHAPVSARRDDDRGALGGAAEHGAAARTIFDARVTVIELLLAAGAVVRLVFTFHRARGHIVVRVEAGVVIVADLGAVDGVLGVATAECAIAEQQGHNGRGDQSSKHQFSFKVEWRGVAALPRKEQSPCPAPSRPYARAQRRQARRKSALRRAIARDSEWQPTTAVPAQVLAGRGNKAVRGGNGEPAPNPSGPG